eukprot:PhM_4_TR16924/c0_g1_i1/m.93804
MLPNNYIYSERRGVAQHHVNDLAAGYTIFYDGDAPSTCLSSRGPEGHKNNDLADDIWTAQRDTVSRFFEQRRSVIDGIDCLGPRGSNAALELELLERCNDVALDLVYPDRTNPFPFIYHRKEVRRGPEDTLVLRDALEQLQIAESVARRRSGQRPDAAGLHLQFAFWAVHTYTSIAIVLHLLLRPRLSVVYCDEALRELRGVGGPVSGLGWSEETASFLRIRLFMVSSVCHAAVAGDLEGSTRARYEDRAWSDAFTTLELLRDVEERQRHKIACYAAQHPSHSSLQSLLRNHLLDITSLPLLRCVASYNAACIKETARVRSKDPSDREASQLFADALALWNAAHAQLMHAVESDGTASPFVDAAARPLLPIPSSHPFMDLRCRIVRALDAKAR